MSKEYIDREEILKAIDEILFKTDQKSEEQIGVLKCRAAIREMEAADVIEVVHGEWTQNDYQEDDNVYECSSCKVEFILESGTPEEYYYNYNYCPNCGARMDGGRKES